MTSNAVETAAAAANQPLTESELERARLFLEQTTNGIVGAMRNLSEAQWSFKPSSERWSIAQIVEHIIFVQERVLGLVREKLGTVPVTPVHPDYKLVDDIIIYQIPNRLVRFPAPAQPAGGLTRSEALERVRANHSQLSGFLEATPGLRSHCLESLPLKAVSNGTYDSMDGYQWILAVAAHTERHTKQALEVMADSEFPL